MLKDDSFRSGTSTSPICDCSLQRETAEHFLLHCTLYQNQRDDIVDQLQQLCWTKKNKSIPITTGHIMKLYYPDSRVVARQNFSLYALFNYGIIYQRN